MNEIYDVIVKGDSEKLEHLLKKATADFFFAESLTVINEKHVGMSPLMLSCSLNNIKLVQILIGSGADVNLPVLPGNKIPLMDAAHRGRIEILKELLMKGADVDHCDTNGCTALHHAAAGGLVECSKILIQHGSKVNVQDKNGNSPLAVASFRGCKESIKLLIDKHAQSQMKNSSDQTSLHTCILGYRNKCANMFINHQQKNTDNDATTKQDYISCVEILLHSGCDVSVVDSENMTVMDYIQQALSQGYDLHEFETILKQNGSDVDRFSKQLEIREMYNAILLNDPTLLKDVLERGTNPGSYFKQFHTEPYVQYDDDSDDSVSDDDQDNDGLMSDVGMTPLLVAVKYRREECMDLLITHGCNINGTSLSSSSVLYKCSPLHMAAFIGWSKGTKCLLHHGADTSSK